MREGVPAAARRRSGAAAALFLLFVVAAAVAAVVEGGANAPVPDSSGVENEEGVISPAPTK